MSGDDTTIIPLSTAFEPANELDALTLTRLASLRDEVFDVRPGLTELKIMEIQNRACLETLGYPTKSMSVIPIPVTIEIMPDS